MSRIKNKLTARTVETKKAPGYYSDGGNLYLRVTKSLAKTWVFYYKKDGKRTEIGLGSFANVSLEQAREKAAELRKQIANGIDPLGERQRQANEDKAQRAKFMTFQQCADSYINAHRAMEKPKTYSTVAKHAFTIRFPCIRQFGR